MDYMDLVILFPLFVILLKFRKFPSGLLPFAYYVLADIAAEIVVSLPLMLYPNDNNSLWTHIVSVSEPVMLFYVFVRINILEPRRPSTWMLAASFVVVYICDGLFFHPFGELALSYFNIYYSLCIVLLSVAGANRVMLSHKKPFNDPVFQFFMAFIIFHSYQIFLEVFYSAMLWEAPRLVRYTLDIFDWINHASYLAYGLILLCTKRRQIFTLQF